MASASSQASVTVKHAGKTLSIPAGTTLSIKEALAKLTDLPAHAQKLVKAGKALRDDDEVSAGAKLMLMRSAASSARTIRLVVREIVSGRVCREKVEIDPAMPHGQLVDLISRALRLPPCDDYTEVRLFLPHAKSLMRQDLSLADYTLAADKVEVCAVPCPISSPPSLAQHAAEMQMAEQQAAEHAAAVQAAEAAAAAAARVDDLAAHAATILSAEDMADIFEHCSMTLPSPMTLPPSITEVAEAEELCESARASAASSAVARAAARAVGPPSRITAEPEPPHAASFVPTRLRSGLMPAIDEPLPPADLPAELMAEMEAYEQQMAPPTAAEWSLFIAHETERLEERCAQLVSSLGPASASPRHTPSIFRSGSSSAGSERSHHRRRGSDLADSRGSLASSIGGASSLLTSSCGSCDDEDEEEEAAEAAEAVVAAALAAVLGGEEWSGAAVGAEPLSSSHGKVPPQPPSRAACKKNACKSCGCRLPLTACATACKCGDVFCPEHMHAHKCSFDYRARAQRKLREDNPKLEGQKLERM